MIMGIPTTMIIPTIMTTPISGAMPADGLHRLLAWSSPSFPIGAFSFSHGLEQAVELGLVTSAATLETWVAHILTRGSGLADAAFLAAAWRGEDVLDLATAWRGSSELALEANHQGRAFLSAVRDGWGIDLGIEQAPLPVAFGMACRDLPLESVLPVYLHAFAANLVSAGVRLVPLGQTDGQRVLAALGPVIASVRPRALDDLATSAPMVDWCAMRHETQYTRLFRS